MTRPSRSALIVSDSAPLRRYAAASLETAGFSCTEAASGYLAIDRLSERLFALYVVDLDMPQSDGISIFAIAMQGRDPSPIAIGFSRRPEAEARTGAWSSTLFSEVLSLPFAPDVLAGAAQAALAGKV
ncbi:MAG TPA: response regulator [Hyphomonadaceae bacterium]|jgi:CheY-like chemotaxis protein|nr:response regulator [Hyphomonadaceae bacterium]